MRIDPQQSPVQVVQPPEEGPVVGRIEPFKAVKSVITLPDGSTISFYGINGPDQDFQGYSQGHTTTLSFFIDKSGSERPFNTKNLREIDPARTNVRLTTPDGRVVVPVVTHAGISGIDSVTGFHFDYDGGKVVHFALVHGQRYEGPFLPYIAYHYDNNRQIIDGRSSFYPDPFPTQSIRDAVSLANTEIRTRRAGPAKSNRGEPPVSYGRVKAERVSKETVLIIGRKFQPTLKRDAPVNLDLSIMGHEVKLKGQITKAENFAWKNEILYDVDWQRATLDGAAATIEERGEKAVALRLLEGEPIQVGRVIRVDLKKRGSNGYIEVQKAKPLRSIGGGKLAKKALAGAGLLFLAATGLEAWNLYRKNGIDDPELQSLALRTALGAIDPTGGLVSGALADTLADHSSSFFQNLTNPVSLLFNGLSFTSLAPALPLIGSLLTFA